jgi:hypothetical protein
LTTAYHAAPLILEEMVFSAACSTPSISSGSLDRVVHEKMPPSDFKLLWLRQKNVAPF